LRKRAEGLLQFLAELDQECSGFIPFQRFMQEALYHPNYGYYTARIQDVGARGDFGTSATISPRLGKAIAAWIQTRAGELDLSKPLHLIELGGGNGALAESVLKSLPWLLRQRLRYHLVEISPVLCQMQQKRLRRWSQVSWHQKIASATNGAGGQALIFSNELVDAFPALWLRRQENAWQEIGVHFQADSGISEVFRDWQAGDLTSSTLQVESYADGQRVEVHQSYRDWLSDWSSTLERGAFLTIDYGGAPAEIYDRRPGGSLRAYHRQQRLEGPAIYQRFGQQDLTADVNFEDLRTWGEVLDWRTTAEQTQADWLQQWAPATSPDAADEMLTQSGGAGDAFRVLEQQRGQVGQDSQIP